MISAVRKALGDSGHVQRYIETVAKSGYRFVAPVRIVSIPYRKRFHGLWTRRTALALGALIISTVGIALLLNKAPRSELEFNVAAKTEPRRSALGPTEGANDALEWYLKGRYVWSRGTEHGLKQSIVYFNKAIADDPRYALAYVGLSDAYASMAPWSVEFSEQAYVKAKQAVRVAIDLDSSLSQAHSSLGMIALFHDWDWPLAAQELRRAVELGPNDPLAHQRLGFYLLANNRMEDALREMRIARSLDPLSVKTGLGVGVVLYHSRRFQEAIAEYRKVIELDPYYSEAHYDLGAAYFVQSEFSNALRELDESSRLVDHREPLALALRAVASARSGDESAVRSVVAELQERSLHEYVTPLSLALIYIGTGQRDQAIQWIEKIFRDRLPAAVLARVDPIFDPVRSDPRFAALLQRVRPVRD